MTAAIRPDSTRRGPERPWERRGWAPSGARDLSEEGAWVSPGWMPSGAVTPPVPASPTGPGRNPLFPDVSGAARPDATGVADASERERARWRNSVTIGDILRLGAAGVLPGWSDNVEAAITFSLDEDMTYAEALKAAEGNLSSAREKAFAPVLEFGTALSSGLGAEMALAKAAGRVPAFLRAVTGLGKGAPRSVGQAVKQGAHIGGFYGALHGTGEAAGGVTPKMVGAVMGAAPGVVGGGLLGGIAQKFIGQPKLDPDDLRAVFQTTDRRALREGEDAVRQVGRELDEIGVDPATRRASAPDAALEMELPGVVADRLGPRGRGILAEADEASALPVREQHGATLGERAAGRAERMAGGVEAITGRPPRTSGVQLSQLEAERKAVNDAMFTRAREASAARTAAGEGPVWTPASQAHLREPDVAEAVEAVRKRMESAARTEGGPAFVDPYLRDKKGKILTKMVGGRPTPQLRPFVRPDPATMSNVALELGDRAAAAGFGTQGSRPYVSAKTVLENEILGAVPEFQQAHALAARGHQRVKAAEYGTKPQTASGRTFRDETAAWRESSPLPIPDDAIPAVEAALRGRGVTTPAPRVLPSPFEDFADAVQYRRVEDMLGLKRDPTRTHDLGNALDELAFGPEKAAQLAKLRQAEENFRATEMAHPFQADKAEARKPSLFARLAGTLGKGARDVGNVAGSPVGARFGGYATADVIGLLGKNAGQIGPEQAAARQSLMMAGQRNPAGLLSPGGTPEDAAWRLFGQARTGYNAPGRRLFAPIPGLLGSGAETRP